MPHDLTKCKKLRIETDERQRCENMHATEARQTLGATHIVNVLAEVNTTACSQRDMFLLRDSRRMIEIPAGITHLVMESDTHVHKPFFDRHRRQM
jgi:hypothetical protein